MNWNQKEIERITSLSNEELFETLKWSDSDDEFDLRSARYALEELESRLRLAGFLKSIL